MNIVDYHQTCHAVSAEINPAGLIAGLVMFIVPFLFFTSPAWMCWLEDGQKWFRGNLEKRENRVNEDFKAE